MAKTTTVVLSLPDCDFGCGRKAHYDGKTKQGPWGYMCDTHFKMHGVGLGVGWGYRLEVKS